MEKNGITDFEKVMGLEFTNANGKVFSRKRVEMVNGEVTYEFAC